MRQRRAKGPGRTLTPDDLTDVSHKAAGNARVPRGQGVAACRARQGLTFLLQPRGQGLPLLKVGARQDAEHLLDAAPAGPGEQLRQPHAERGVAAVHVGDVRGVLLGNQRGKACGCRASGPPTRGLSVTPSSLLEAEPQATSASQQPEVRIFERPRKASLGAEDANVLLSLARNFWEGGLATLLVGTLPTEGLAPGRPAQSADINCHVV